MCIWKGWMKCMWYVYMCWDVIWWDDAYDVIYCVDNWDYIMTNYLMVKEIVYSIVDLLSLN